MSKRISVIVVPEEEGEVRRIVIPKGIAILLITLLFVIIGSVAFLGYRYWRVYTLARKATILEERVALLEKEKRETIERATADLNRVVYENQRLLTLLGIEDTQPDYTKGNPQEGNIPSIWPTKGWISQGYSPYHQAVDIAAPIGTPIVSTINGVVTSVWTDSLLGSVLEVSNEEGYKIVYAHNSTLTVKEGDKVNRGNIVAFVGTSGITSGPHLHYEIYYNDSVLNPEQYLPSNHSNP
jgi:murein DD-endopeptidase MepM/ murein hydrolase activator NlpD